MRWWQFGLCGSLVLSVATAVKALRAIFSWGDVDWRDLPLFVAAIIGIGFLCGVIVWAGRGLYHRLGMAGDAIVGLAVMVAFFISCMLFFDPEMLGTKFLSAGIPMLGLAIVIGLIGGAWIGRDLRKESAPEDVDRAPGGTL